MAYEDEEEWVIYNGSMGAVDTATIDIIEVGSDGRRVAYFEEPYDIVGPLDFDELEASGVISFAACLIMSKERWREDQDELRRDSWEKRRASAQNAREAEDRFWREHAGEPTRASNRDRAHREALDLPTDGMLQPGEIQQAYRILAKQVHPDAGGSHERFIRITEARDALLQQSA